MQSEFDKEIDALLREGARRGLTASAAPVRQRAGERVEDGEVWADPSGAHLDADEQNAYAENSLPPSARTYYAAHLADCDVCRRSVTQLALAAGMPSQLEQHAAATVREVLPNVTWRERIGALFAPRAWRYAVPALALLLVGAVALMVLMRGRVQQGEVSVAEQRSSAPEQAKPASSETHHAPQDNNAAVVVSEGDAQSASNSNAPGTKEELAAAGKEEQGQPKGRILNDETAPPPPPAPLTAGTGTTSAPVASSAAPDMPMPEATPEAVITSQEAEKRSKVGERADEFAKDAQKPGNYENLPPRDRISGPRRNNEQARNIQRGVNNDSSDSADKNDRASATPALRAPTASARRAKPREADAERSDGASGVSARSEETLVSKSVAETRTVAGRKFRREGNAWIDTAYNSSQAVTVVRRNSEQYRALVADEPQLRRIGDALGGEVTVVWKGRAYRIR